MLLMPADLILHNARVLTMDPDRPKAGAAAVADGRLLAVGDESEVMPLRGAGTKAIDCRGLTLVPGFIDAHIHLLSYAAFLASVDCSPSAVSTIGELRAAVARKAATVPPGAWIRAVGYDEAALTERRHPSRHDLDAAAPHHPVRLLHRTGHACVLNTLALAWARIDAATEEPPGGYMERDLSTGEPTGLLLEMNELVERAVPPPDFDELAATVAEASRRLITMGVTSLEDATAGNGPQEWALLERLMTSGCLRQDVTLMEGFANLGELPARSDLAPLRRGAVKIAVSETGERLAPDEQSLAEMVWEVHRAGRQAAVHAVEERTVAAAVSAIERAVERLPRRDHRHRIEHCAVCPPHLARRLAAVGAVAVGNPGFLYHQGERYRRQVPKGDLPHLYDAAGLRAAGAVVAAGSDAPVVPPGAAAGLVGAARRTAAGTRLPGEAPAPREALALHTRWAAYASFLEGEKGMLRPSFQADLVLLSSSPEVAPTGDGGALGTEISILRGKVAWAREGWCVSG